MKNSGLVILFMGMILGSCSSVQQENPFFKEYETPYGVPPFEQIEAKHYSPAFIQGMKEQNDEILAIINYKDKPDFENTIAAIDASGELLDKVGKVFFSLLDAETNDTLQNIAKEISPLLSEHEDNILMNDKLFGRVQEVYNHRTEESLTQEQQRLLEKIYKNFVRSGALLNDSGKEKLKEINKELSTLLLQFSDNVLAENNAFKLWIDNESDLSGLPQWFCDASAEEAASAGQNGKWLITLESPSRTPFLKYADNRLLREKVYKAYISRGDNDNAHDNKKNIEKILNLRLQKAKLLGYATYADFVLEDRMAKNSANVDTLINKVWEKALLKAKTEALALQQQINKGNDRFDLAAWDWEYYTEKLRREKYNLNEEEVKPYFSLDNVRDGAFMVANRLWGITFDPIKDIPRYHTDVLAYEVKDADGKHLSVLYMDFFPRAGKSGGAWMSNFREQYIINGKDVRPVVYNVSNFTKPTKETPSLLTIEEVQTLFHEFGHALHGMLTHCRYRSISGTNVATDFVELPSQIMEHWATYPDVLKLYAKHYKTGEAIPDELIDKIKASSTFNQGFATTEFVGAAILDMKSHEIKEEQNLDVRALEKEIVKQMGIIPEITVRYRLPYFTHIFANDYAAGYYSYLWAEVLDADAFDAFVENGIFDNHTAKLYRENILEKGDSEEPMDLYVAFRGKAPDPLSLMKNRGLVND